MKRDEIAPSAPTTEDRLHILLGRLVHAFGRFDFNIGLQLKWMGPYCGEKVEHLLNARMPFAIRLDALEPLVMKLYCHEDEDAMRDFSRWFEHARTVKALRNDFVHGRWAVYPSRSAIEPKIEFIALNWEMEQAKQIPPMSIKLEELGEAVRTLEFLFNDYWKLTEHYESNCRPPTCLARRGHNLPS